MNQYIIKSIFIFASAVILTSCSFLSLHQPREYLHDSDNDFIGLVSEFDWFTKTPLQGATVVLECRKNKFIHGTKSIGKHKFVTDENGRYVIPYSILTYCPITNLSPKKEGYVLFKHIDDRYNYFDYRRFPSEIIFIPLIKRNLIKLRIILKRLSKTKVPDKWDVSVRLKAYDHISTLKRAIINTKTKKERKFVYDNICTRYFKLLSLLNEKEIDSIYDPIYNKNPDNPQQTSGRDMTINWCKNYDNPRQRKILEKDIDRLWPTGPYDKV